MLNKKISNTIRKSAHKLLETKVMISVIMLAILSMTSLTYLPTYAASPPQPTYGTATVDGNIGEWNLTEDFFSNMYRAADITKQLESTVYLRYDCDTETLFVLVLANTTAGVTIRANETANQWVKVDGDGIRVNGDSGNDGTPPDFAFVGLSGNTSQGWEASFYLPEGLYPSVDDQTGLNVHAQVNDGGTQTSAVPDRGIDLAIVCPDCPTTTATTTETTTDTSTTTFTDCTTTDTTTTETTTDTTTATTTDTTTATTTETDCTTTIGTTTETTTATTTETDCTTTIGTTTETTTATTTLTTTEGCYLGDGGISNFGKIECEGPNVIVGATALPDIWNGAAGTYPADWIDATAAALLWGLCEDGVLYWDHDPTEVNQATGETQLAGHEIMSGGPLVNAPVKYYEGQKLAPVYYKASGGYARFFDSGTDTQISGAQLLGSEIDESKDMFVIMIMQKPDTDADPEYAIMAYGFAGRGTLASSVYFKTTIEPNLSSYTMDWIIVQWDDTNGNFHPDIPGTDTYTVIATGP